MLSYDDPRLPAPFWVRVVPEPMSGCWLWVGAATHDGYARFRDGLAHREIYSVLHGEIAKRMEIDHLCRVRCCVNPWHLEAVTKQENMRRGVYGVLTTRCPNGHPYDEANTYRWGATRSCRACNRARNSGRDPRAEPTTAPRTT